MTDVETRDDPRRFDVAVLGGGSAAETLVAELAPSGCRVVVFEPARVGGECPFVACMPTKAMLHDVAIGRTWSQSVQRRFEVAEHLDDENHARELERHGAVLVRAAARVRDAGTVEAAGERYHADHIVLATGSEPIMPPIDGLEELDDRRWTSADAMIADDRPIRLLIVGGGVVGCELATIFSGFGTEVHMLDTAPRAFPDLPSEIGDLVDETLAARGVRVRRGVTITRTERRGGGVRVVLDNGAFVETDRLLVATGSRPRTEGLGLEALGLDPTRPLPVESDGRVSGPASLWAVGDVAGSGEYTHLANHQARVVADALVGDGTRRFDDVVTPACVFTDPPILTIGPTPADDSSETLMWSAARVGEIPRATTDELEDGYLTIGVDRSTQAVVAAHGIGAGFDELAAALVTAIDGQLPVDRLARSMWPFPSIGEILGVAYSRAVDSLDAP